MKNTIRNILVVVAVIVIAYFAITVVSNIVPILITAVAAFVLGRLSVHFDLLNFIRSARAAQVTRAAAAVTATAAAVAPVAAAANVAAKPAAPAQVDQAAERLADEPKVDKNILLDPNFEIKTPDQIEAEARLREQEVMKKASSASPDSVQAALEERRKRLLGGKE